MLAKQKLYCYSYGVRNKFSSLTLKRILRRHREIEKKHPKDRKIHQIIKPGSVEKKGFLGFIMRSVKNLGLI